MYKTEKFLVACYLICIDFDNSVVISCSILVGSNLNLWF